MGERIQMVAQIKAVQERSACFLPACLYSVLANLSKLLASAATDTVTPQ